MRMAELSATTGVPVATIKYYLREGLLAPGESSAPNQAEYDDSHVQRLRLIRVLVDVGGLSIAAVRDVVAAIDSPERTDASVIGVVHHAVTRGAELPDEADVVAAQGEIDSWLAGLGWQVTAGAPARRTLAEALAGLRRLGREVTPDAFGRYAAAAEKLAGWELRQTVAGRNVSRGEMVEGVVIGTVVYEAVLVSLRRLAQEHVFTSRYLAGKS